MDLALARLRKGMSICAEINLLPQWWAHRVAVHLLSNLWTSTFHECLPLLPAGGDAASWPSLRELFIASLVCRHKAEIDLWPSQIAAAARALDQADDLVVSLPTSAGKTRISELCILRCLAAGRRVIFVTPLRALSARTEATLQRTFGPHGKTISALYGSIGVRGFDEEFSTTSACSSSTRAIAPGLHGDAPRFRFWRRARPRLAASGLTSATIGRSAHVLSVSIARKHNPKPPFTAKHHHFYYPSLPLDCSSSS
jgi:hypothetical protein